MSKHLRWATQTSFCKSNSHTAETLLKQSAGGNVNLHSFQQQLFSQQQKPFFVSTGQPTTGMLGILYLFMPWGSSMVSFLLAGYILIDNFQYWNYYIFSTRFYLNICNSDILRYLLYAVFCILQTQNEYHLFHLFHICLNAWPDDRSS